jgi:LPXTG-motif cell wall anchor domain protein
VPNEAPVNEVDEFHQAVPEDAPIVPELPEYNFEVPNDAPVNEVEEFHQAVPDTAPVHEISEFHQAIPEDAPVNDVEEFHFEVPSNAPVNEVPELIVEVPSEEPVETPEMPATENTVPVLPQTGENDSQWVSALGLVLLGMVGIQLKQKKKEDE